MRRLVTLLALLAWIPLCRQPTWGQAPSVRENATQQPKQKSELTTSQSDVGTEAAPLVVETHSRPESKSEAAEAQKDKDQTDFINRWTLCFAGAAALFTGLLVWVGWRGVRIANGTLKSIVDQTAAAKRSTDALVSIERAWIFVQPDPLAPKLQVSVPEVEGSALNLFVYRIWNAGRSAATDLKVSVQYHLLNDISELSEVPEYDPLKDFPGVVVPTTPESANALLGWEELKPVSILFQWQIDAIVTQQKLLYAYGIVRYKHALGSEGVTRFGFLYHFPLGGEIRPRGFHPGGPRAYNGAE